MEHIDLMYISVASVLPATFLSLGVYGKLPTPLKMLAWFLYCSCLIELSAFLLFQFSINNMVVYHIHTIVEFAFLSLIYYHILRSWGSLKQLILVLASSFTVFSVLNLILWENLSDFNSIQRGAEYGVVMLYVTLHFMTLLRRKRSSRLEFHPYFVLSLGFFIYFSGTIFLFLNVNRFIDIGTPNQWELHSILNIFINIIYFIVLWKSSRRTIHS